MEKMRKMRGVVIFMMLFLCIGLVQAALSTTKTSYKSTDVVNVRSTSLLCNNLESGVNVSVYVVEDKENWSEGDSLEDVRGDPSIFSNSKFTLKMLWDNPSPGNYDIVIDCIENGKYDTLEPLISSNGAGFSVSVVAGRATVAKGPKDIGDHTWEYDPEALDMANEVLQLSLTSYGEDVTLTNITLMATGTGDDTKIEAVEVYVDDNGNGQVDLDEGVIGDLQPAYSADNGVSTVPLDYVLSDNVTENILIVYTMQKEISKGEFSLTVASMYGVGYDSDKIILFSGTPITSGITKILPPKTCLGGLTFAISPDPAKQGEEVSVSVDNMTGCDGKEVSIKSNPCANKQTPLASCKLDSEGGCEAKFKATIGGRHYACIDKNGDLDFIDFGESVFKDLALIVPENVTKEEPENVTEGETTTEGQTGEETTGEENNISSNITDGEKITGGATIAEMGQKISEASGFLVLLEVTLLLILFVLVMILFRLKNYAPVNAKDDEED